MFPKNCNELEGWTLFLDRDGVINKLLPGDYVKTPQEFEIIEGVDESLKFFREVFKYMFITTNQQGIGKGIMTHEDLNKVHDYMISQLSIPNPFDKIYYAPQLNKDNSIFRKPNPGMALKARSEFPEVDFEKSILVGDSVSDIEFAKTCGMKTVGIKLNGKCEADLHVESLHEFYKYLNK
jgi:histidinol-phosphate phosphatase family protein